MQLYKLGLLVKEDMFLLRLLIVQEQDQLDALFVIQLIQVVMLLT